MTPLQHQPAAVCSPLHRQMHAQMFSHQRYSAHQKMYSTAQQYFPAGNRATVIMQCTSPLGLAVDHVTSVTSLVKAFDVLYSCCTDACHAALRAIHLNRQSQLLTHGLHCCQPLWQGIGKCDNVRRSGVRGKDDARLGDSEAKCDV